MAHVSRGFRGKRGGADQSRLPPGQYVVEGFPVLSAGPTPYTSLEEWNFSIVGEVTEPLLWSWEAFKALPSEDIRTDASSYPSQPRSWGAACEPVPNLFFVALSVVMQSGRARSGGAD